MTAPEPRFFESENKILAHLEWEAIRMIVFNGKYSDIGDAYPKFEQRQFYWVDPYMAKATSEHHQLKRQLHNNEITSLDDFYEKLKPFLKSKPRGKLLRDKKKRTAQVAYQREQLGDDFIDNKPLIAAAKAEAMHLNAIRADKRTVFHKAAELAAQYHDGSDYSEGQMKVLCDLIQHQMDKLMHPDSVEAKLIDTNKKNLWFMWGKIKRQYAVGDSFTLTTEEARKLCRCSKSDIGPIMKKLCSVGALTLLQSGKAGKSSGRAALYRREA
jgi:hypothetical protein